MRDKFILFVLSIMFAIIMSISATIRISHAADATVYDANGNVNFTEIDQMLQAQDNQVKFAAVNENQIILSDKPIHIVVKQPRIMSYKPKRLIDLGYQFNLGAAPDAIISSVPAYSLADASLYELPTIPAIPTTQTTTTSVAASTPAVSSSSTVTTTSAPVISSYAMNVIMQSALVLFLIVLFGSVLVYLINLIQSTVPGSKGTSKAIHHDEDFIDFKRTVIHGTIMPMNTTTLNMLCNVKKFSNASNTDTYFYMSYYVPSQHAYAAALRAQTQEERQVELEG